MRIALRRPGRALANRVEVLWFQEGPGLPHPKERLLPDGSMELVINLREDELRAWDKRNPVRYERLDRPRPIRTCRPVSAGGVRRSNTVQQGETSTWIRTV